MHLSNINVNLFRNKNKVNAKESSKDKGKVN